MQDEKTKKRELRALIKASKELKHIASTKLLLIIMDNSSVELIDGIEIEILNIIE